MSSVSSTSNKNNYNNKLLLISRQRQTQLSKQENENISALVKNMVAEATLLKSLSEEYKKNTSFTPNLDFEQKRDKLENKIKEKISSILNKNSSSISYNSPVSSSSSFSAHPSVRFLPSSSSSSSFSAHLPVFSSSSSYSAYPPVSPSSPIFFHPPVIPSSPDRFLSSFSSNSHAAISSKEKKDAPSIPVKRRKKSDNKNNTSRPIKSRKISDKKETPSTPVNSITKSNQSNLSVESIPLEEENELIENTYNSLKEKVNNLEAKNAHQLKTKKFAAIQYFHYFTAYEPLLYALEYVAKTLTFDEPLKDDNFIPHIERALGINKELSDLLYSIKNNHHSKYFYDELSLKLSCLRIDINIDHRKSLQNDEKRRDQESIVLIKKT